MYMAKQLYAAQKNAAINELEYILEKQPDETDQERRNRLSKYRYDRTERNKGNVWTCNS